MRAPRLLLVPMLVAALGGCASAPPVGAPDADAPPLVERAAQPSWQDVPEALPVEDTAIPLDLESLVPWSPSEAPTADAHVDISWTDAAVVCDHAVDRVRVAETAERVVIDLQQGPDVDDGIGCGDSQSLRTARIPLAEPLGDRELLQHAAPVG